MTLDCQHGQLARSCPMCEYESMIATLEQENRQMRARMERLQGIADAAKNLVAQKGRHNTKIAYQRLEEAVKKGE